MFRVTEPHNIFWSAILRNEYIHTYVIVYYHQYSIHSHLDTQHQHPAHDCKCGGLEIQRLDIPSRHLTHFLYNPHGSGKLGQSQGQIRDSDERLELELYLNKKSKNKTLLYD